MCLELGRYLDAGTNIISTVIVIIIIVTTMHAS